MTRRLSIVAVALAVVATACSAGGKADGLTGFESRGPDQSATFADPGEVFMVADAPLVGSSGGLRAALGTAGIRVIADPAESSGRGLELWSYQVDNMERGIDDGSGYLGVQLDELVGSPGGMPFSYLLAGWLVSAPTPTAEQARSLIGDQPWEQAPSIVFPTAVIVLFVADAVNAADSVDATAMVNAQLVALAQAGVCSTLAGWVNGVLDFIFESLKVDTDDGGFLGWLGVIWNAALDLVQGVIEGLIGLLTAPVVAAITSALAIVGTLSMVASILQPWNLDLEPSNPTSSFAVGNGPNVQERVVATADPGYEFEWPPSVEDCASVAGLNLPNPTDAEGSTIKWKEIGFPALGSVTEIQTELDAENMATVDWITGREESAEGPTRSGTVSMFASVDLKQIEELKAMIGNLITNQIPSGPFEGIVTDLISGLTAPVFDALAELVRVKGTTSVTVFYHDEKEEEEPVPDSAVGCVTGRWRVNGSDAAAIFGAQIFVAGANQQAYTEGSVNAEFDEDGSVTFNFSGWKVGAKSLTEGGIVNDLTGDVYTLSSGTADGNWRIQQGLLELRLTFKTNTVQRIISEELEINNTIDVVPDFARLYLLPGGPTRYICNDTTLGIEWENGAGTRWFRTG